MLLNKSAIKKIFQENGKQISNSFLFALEKEVKKMILRSIKAAKRRVTDVDLYSTLYLTREGENNG